MEKPSFSCSFDDTRAYATALRRSDAAAGAGDDEKCLECCMVRIPRQPWQRRQRRYRVTKPRESPDPLPSDLARRTCDDQGQAAVVMSTPSTSGHRLAIRAKLSAAGPY